MKIKIDPELLKVYPDIHLGCLSYEAKVVEENPKMWEYLNAKTVPELMAVLQEKELAQIEGIRSSREAYKAFGRSPSKYRVSSESLIRRLRQGHELYHVNSVVDVNNLVSIETALSLGSYDIEKVEGDIVLTVGKEGDGYEGIGKSFINMEKMLILKDDQGPFGSPTSDSHRAMIKEESQKIVTIIYCFSDRMNLDEILKSTKEYFETYAGAKEVETWIV